MMSNLSLVKMSNGASYIVKFLTKGVEFRECLRAFDRVCHSHPAGYSN